MYLLLGPCAFFLNSRHHLLGKCMWAGLIIMTAGLLGAAFARSVGSWDISDYC